jgi:CRISPR-associated endoribonuclease Cas6
MPYSLVFNFLPKSAIYPKNLSGRHLHALFLDLVRSVDPELSSFLHQQLTEKAFTLSPLQVAIDHNHPQTKHSSQILQWQHTQPISEGTLCWWRICLLDDRLFSKLAPLWLNFHSNKFWHLGSVELELISTLGTPQSDRPWANFATYTQIYDRASDCQRKINFHFCTPTAFKQGKYDTSLPTKELIFQGLLRRWNRYSNNPFPETILEPIYPSFFDLHTEIIIDSRSKFIGCVGEITFQILGEVEPSIIKQINTLADFAFYAGVGKKTPMGMGQTQYRSLN